MPDTVRSLLSGDRALANAVAANLSHLDLSARGHAEIHRNQMRLSLSAPATVRGAAGGTLQLADLALQGSVQKLTGSLDAALTGRGLPMIKLGLPSFALSDGAFRGQTALTARLDYASFHGIVMTTAGAVSGRSGEWTYSPASCAKMTLAAFRPGPNDLATKIADICPLANKALLSFGHDGMKLAAAARGVSANFPLANVGVEKAEGTLDFGAKTGVPLYGAVALRSARLLDRAASRASSPCWAAAPSALAAACGAANSPPPTKRNRRSARRHSRTPWQTGPAPPISLRRISLSRRQASAGNSVAAAGGVPPRRRRGGFRGRHQLDARTINSRGNLAVASLDFITPLGKAHAVKTNIDFTSLLPPARRRARHLTISRIDWTLPFSAVDVRFAFSPTTVQVDKARQRFCGRSCLAWARSRIDLANPGHDRGRGRLVVHLAGSLVTASNLGSKVKLEGKVSGHVPFSPGPDGFRIANGHVAADGAGRLSVDRSLWVQGDAAISSNAVQDFAYQALENLAFDSCQRRSEFRRQRPAANRLSHQGQKRSAQAPDRRSAITDIINGTALYKPIPLPSGTPIDLTLDTSLNFDELLKSYAEAWSKTLIRRGTAD